MKLHATLLAAAIAAAAATSASAQTTPPPPPADTTASAPAPAAPAPGRVRRDPDLITTAEIQAASVNDALDLVMRLRPRWLRGHAGTTTMSGAAADPVIVYVNGTRLGIARELRAIKAESISEMRFIRSEDAIMRYGVGHSSGVILVTPR
jgi:hypothetical protein